MTRQRKPWTQYHKPVGLDYHSIEWQKLREQILERDHFLCQPCLENGRITTATMVDHKEPKSRFASGAVKGDPDHPSNLQSICKTCHGEKSAHETGRSLKKAELHRKLECDWLGIKYVPKK